jgi:hypothetical protein
VKFCIISTTAIILVSSLDCMQATKEVEVCLVVCLAEKSTSIAMVDRVRKQDLQSFRGSRVIYRKTGSLS